MKMGRFRVWVPNAKKVELCIGDIEYSMMPVDNGYWQLQLQNLQPHLLYAYKIDGRGPFPDPASPFLPEGVHGRSQRWVEEFAWNDKDWKAPGLENAVIYELHVGTFSQEGTYAALQARLDHFINLGVTHIELLPIAAFPGNHGWGYDGVGLCASHKAYGTPTQLKQLVDACHARGLSIILDVVYNHLGPDGNYLEQYAPYFSDRYHTPWGKAVNFDGSFSDQVREFFIENALGWLRDFHFDGLRLDAVHEIYDFSATHILEEMQKRVDELAAATGKSFVLIAESDLNDPKLIRSVRSGGYNLGAQWLDDFHHSVHVMLTGESHGYYRDFSGAIDLKKCLRNAFVYDGKYSVARKRRHGRAVRNVDPWRFVVCTQNHDQVGNRAFGERLCHLVSFEFCQIAAALLFMSPYVPMIFQGEEWAASSPFLYFTDHTDEKLARAVREGRRREYPAAHGSARRVPDPQSAQTFAKSILKWEEIASGSHAEMHLWYRSLVALRLKYIKEIRSDRRCFEIIDDVRKLYVYSCGRLSLIVNAGEHVGELLMPGQSPQVLLQNHRLKQSAGSVFLQPGTAAVIHCE